MKINTRTLGDVKVLDCNGKITLGEGTLVVRKAVNQLLDGGAKKIVLNLGDVDYIDSSGIGELVSTCVSVANRGGELRLLNLTKRIQGLLAITKLLTVFKVFDNEKAAVSF